MRGVILRLFFLNLGCLGEGAVKIWKFDYDIFNPDHWIDGKPSQQCDGLDMRDAKHTYLVVDRLDVKQILFPNYTKIYLPEGARINIHEDYDGEMDCVRIKNNFGSHSWLDPASWTVEGVEHNAAVPHLERIPCRHDDLIFPKGLKSSACYIDYMVASDPIYVKVKSFKFGDDYLTDNDLKELAYGLIPLFPYYLHRYVSVDGNGCEDPTGCVCGSSLEDGICAFVVQPQQYQCLDPLTPIGFCTKICGASIRINDTTSPDFKANFKIDRVRKALEGYSSETHVSKIRDGSESVIQIVFSEKEFTGVSLDEARDFYSVLLTDNSFGVAEADLLSSGIRFVKGEVGRTALSIVFGTLFGVLLIFGLIFFVNSPHFARLNLRNRFHLTTRPLSTLLARYEKMDDERMAFQKAESVLSLEKSFDNPMYGTSAPPTASTSAVESSEVSTAKSGLENPMYEIENRGRSGDSGDRVEESELVDLESSREATEEVPLGDLTSSHEE